MKSKDIENIVIALLIGVIVYMIYKRNERLNATPTSTSTSPSLKTQEDINVMQMPEEVKKQVEQNPEYPYDSNLPKPGKKRNDNLNEFLDEYMNYTRFGNKIEQITTDDEINAYRKSFLDFRNVTNTSSHGFDPVDEMNLEKVSGLYQGGLKVKDVYDKIAAKNFDTTKIDVNSMQFNERVDNYIRSNTFEYDNDEVSNGGFFFEKIRGSEGRNEHYQAFP
jgi:hypothetical protein